MATTNLFRSLDMLKRLIPFDYFRAYMKKTTSVRIKALSQVQSISGAHLPINVAEMNTAPFEGERYFNTVIDKPLCHTRALHMRTNVEASELLERPL